MINKEYKTKTFDSCSHIVCLKCYDLYSEDRSCLCCGVVLHCKKGAKRTYYDDWYCINHYIYSDEAQGID